MEFCTLFNKRRPLRQVQRRTRWRCCFLLPLPSMLVLLTVALLVALFLTKLHPKFLYSDHVPSELVDVWSHNETTSVLQFQEHGKAVEARNASGNQFFSHPNFSYPLHHQIGASLPSPQHLQLKRKKPHFTPYHDWEAFEADYQEMLRTLKIFIYPEAFKEDNYSSPASPFANIFLPLPNPMDPNLGNYYSEHAFKIALLHSSLVTKDPEEAHFFFMPFSINAMRNHPLLHSASSISDFVAQYTTNISSELRFWNASGGADHFYVCCHSIGRDAASKHPALHTNAIQVTCSSSYFQRLYITHKDIGLPQIWPRKEEPALNPPDARY